MYKLYTVEWRSCFRSDKNFVENVERFILGADAYEWNIPVPTWQTQMDFDALWFLADFQQLVHPKWKQFEHFDFGSLHSSSSKWTHIL